MYILLCLVLWSNWSLGVHILQDIEEIDWASQNWMNIFSFIPAETPEMGTETIRTVIILFNTPENLLVGISGALGWEKATFFFSKKCILRKYCVVSQKWWMLELSNLCHCVQHPWKLTSRDFWSSRNDREPLSKWRCVLRKCCGLSQKWWMLELSNLCHCVQHPWKLTSRDFWSSRNDRKPLSKWRCVLRKCCGVSQKWYMLELSNLYHCVQPK